MNETVRIELDVVPETAAVLADSRRKAAVAAWIDRLVRQSEHDELAQVFADTRRTARAAGLVVGSLAWRSDRRCGRSAVAHRSRHACLTVS